MRPLRICACVLGLGLPAAAWAELLLLGSEGVNPPLSMLAADGGPGGFEPDLARAICARIGADCGFVVMDFMELVPALKAGEIAMVVANLAPTEERRKTLLFTDPILRNPVNFVVPQHCNAPIVPQTLLGKGLRIGLLRGDSTGQQVEDRFGTVLSYVYYDSVDTAVQDLQAGRVAMLALPRITAALHLIDTPQGAGWKLVGDGDAEGAEGIGADPGMAWALRPDAAPLAAQVNAALQEMLADCSYTAIRKAYVGVPLLPGDAACDAAGR